MLLKCKTNVLKDVYTVRLCVGIAFVPIITYFYMAKKRGQTPEHFRSSHLVARYVAAAAAQQQQQREAAFSGDNGNNKYILYQS